MHKITPFLWFGDRIEDAVTFYVSVFKDGEILNTARVGGESGSPGKVMSMTWNRLLEGGGKESQCGWLKDRFGLSWQVIPEALGRYIGDPDRAKGQRALQAMLQMKKIDIATLETAHRGEL